MRNLITIPNSSAVSALSGLVLQKFHCAASPADLRKSPLAIGRRGDDRKPIGWLVAINSPRGNLRAPLQIARAIRPSTPRGRVILLASSRREYQSRVSRAIAIRRDDEHFRARRSRVALALPRRILAQNGRPGLAMVPLQLAKPRNVRIRFRGQLHIAGVCGYTL